MKKLIILGLISLAISSCNKENFKEVTTNSSEEAKLTGEKGLSSIPATTYQCIGKCSNSSIECGIIFDLNTGEGRCSCEGCKLDISKMSQSVSSLEIDMKSLANYFVDYIYDKQGVKNYLVSKLSISKDLEAEYMMVEYWIDNKLDSDNVFSLLFMRNNSTGNTIVVDCVGSCPDKNCVEAFSEGKVYCKCQDNCKFTTSQIQTPYLSRYK